MWFVSGITLMGFLGGPRGAVERYIQPVQDELGGWLDLALNAAGWNRITSSSYGLSIEPEVFRAAALLARDSSQRSIERSERWWFPAKLRAEGVDYPVDLQFAGAPTATSRITDQKWRVRFRNKASYRGIREFELAPADENQHAVELMIRDKGEASGLLAPPGGFAHLSINGSAAGTFFWSESNSKAMLDRLGYPNGEILTPRVTAAAIPARLAGVENGRVGYAHYVPAIDRDGDWSIAEVKLERLLALIQNASDAEFEQQIPELLDIEKFLNWNALVSIFGDPASNGYPPLNWFFDPVTGLLEPILRDLALNTQDDGEASDAARLTARLLHQPALRGRSNVILWELVGRNGGEVVAQSDAKLGELLTHLAKSTGSLVHFGQLRRYADCRRSNRLALIERVSTLSTALAASQVETTPILSVDAGTPTLTLKLAPAGLAMILLSEIRFELSSAEFANHEAATMRITAPGGHEILSEPIAPVMVGSSLALRPEHASIEPSITGRDASWTVEIRLPFFSAEQWVQSNSIQSIDIVYRNAVTGESLPAARLMTAEMLARTPDGDYRALFRSIESTIAASGLPFEIDGDEIVLPAGNHRVAQTIVVPRSHRLRLEPGVTLHLDPNVSLITFRGISAKGTAGQPIHLRATDSERPWGALGVARAPESSTLTFVTVSGGSKTSFQGIEFDGQLSFNASDVYIDNSEIYDARKADGLSVKRGSFEIHRSQFVANGSDGINSEWSTGQIRESLFINNEDDGVDMADSTVRIDESAFHWMGDKSISAGERSRVTVVATRLSDSDIAIASKEDSRVDVRGTEFRRNHTGFSLYRSKPVFGGGSGSVRGGVFARNDRDFEVEPGSNLELNDVQRESGTTADALVGSLALRSVVTRSR
ncbi:MAG: CotH kinase family protein [Deltaproteobacteria bacterium]|nr:CotH kinase family protein [Deltaproteobacteria bacterium]